MRWMFKLTLAGLLALLLLLAVGGYGLHYYLNRWRAAPGVTVEFEVADPKVDMAREIAAVNQRLAGISRKVVTQPSATHVAVWIPYPAKLQQALTKRDAAMDDFRKTELTPSRLEAILKLPAAERTAEINHFAPAGTALRDPLLKLAAAYDTSTANRAAAATTTAPATRAAALIAGDAYDEALEDVFRQVLDARRFTDLLNAADDPANVAARTQRDELVATDPAQATEILHAIAAQKEWDAAGGHMTLGPDDIERLLLPQGVLDFRIAPTDLAPADLRAAIASLRLHGPSRPVRLGAEDFRWFEIDAASLDNFQGNLIVASFYGHPCVLLCDDHPHTLAHNDPLRNPWSITAGTPSFDTYPCVPFHLDATGAGYMGDLTSANLKRPMALVLDDQARSAPTIQSRIGDAGQITLGQPSPAHSAAALRREAQDLSDILSHPPLPSVLRRVH